MGTRKPPSEFALSRGRLMRRARDRAGWSQALVAKKLGLKSREVVSQYEHGKIEDPDESVCRAIVLHLGLEPGEVARDPTMFQFTDLPPVSSDAKRVARQFDSLPDHVKQLIIHAINASDGALPRPRLKKTRRPKKE